MNIPPAERTLVRQPEKVEGVRALSSPGLLSPGLHTRTLRDASFPDGGSVRTLRTSWEALAGPSRRPPIIESRARRHRRIGFQTRCRGGEASRRARTIRRARSEDTRWRAKG